MILIGRYLSPFVRRVAATLIYQNIEFEHRAIRAGGAEQDIVRQSNPLGRVPAFILDDDEVLSDSAVILDHIDDMVGEERALMPRSGWERAHAMNLLSIATGAAEKTVAHYMEFNRPEDKQDSDTANKAGRQAKDGFEYLNAMVKGEWMFGEKLSQLDISLAAYLEFFRISSPEMAKSTHCPALDGIVARSMALPCFIQTDPRS